MEMTPEQKAFYEYGQARGILKERKELMISMEGEFDAAIYYPEYRELYHIEEAIRDAWQKRAACRAVIVSNDCIKCIRFPNKYPGWKCPGCEWATFTKTVKSRWEPRKEGE